MIQFILLSLVTSFLYASEAPTQTMQRTLSIDSLSGIPKSPPALIPESPVTNRGGLDLSRRAIAAFNASKTKTHSSKLQESLIPIKASSEPTKEAEETVEIKGTQETFEEDISSVFEMDL